MTGLLLATLLAAGPNPFLAEAKAQYEALEFEKCTARLKQAATQWKSAPEELRDIELYSGLCTYNLGQAQRAAEHFRTALRIDEATELPPYTSPKLVELFLKVKQDLQKPPEPFPDSDLPDDAPTKPRLEPKPKVAPEVVAPAKPLPLKPAVPLALGGAAVAAAVAAIAVGAAASGLASQANAASFESDFYRLGEQARGTATASNVLWGTSAALAAGAAFSWFLLPNEPAK